MLNHLLQWPIRILGLPGIREYPIGTTGTGDIDSGPIVMGIGGAASIVGIRAAAMNGDWSVAEGLRNGTGALLFAQNDGSEKRHLFGQLPILDAFTAWAIAGACSKYSGFGAEPRADLKQENWRWKFQAISTAVVIFLILAIWKTRKPKYQKTLPNSLLLRP